MRTLRTRPAATTRAMAAAVGLAAVMTLSGCGSSTPESKDVTASSINASNQKASCDALFGKGADVAKDVFGLDDSDKYVWAAYSNPSESGSLDCDLQQAGGDVNSGYYVDAGLASVDDKAGSGGAQSKTANGLYVYVSPSSSGTWSDDVRGKAQKWLDGVAKHVK